MSLQNTVNTVKVPFPPSITIDEIVQKHLRNEIKIVNTVNAFMIYRKEYNHAVAKFNLECKHVSKFASISWKNEPQYIKNYYKQFAKNVKRRFKEIVPSLCFIHVNQVLNTNNTNDNNVSLDKNNLDTTYINNPVLPLHPIFPPHPIFPLHPIPIHPLHPIHPIHPPLPLCNSEQKFLDAYPPLTNSTNSPLPNDQETDPSFLNVDHDKYMTMDDDDLINYLPEDIALTYKAIIQSLPF